MFTEDKVTEIYCLADYFCKFFGFKIHLICNEKGELLNFMFTPGNIDDREPLYDKESILGS